MYRMIEVSTDVYAAIWASRQSGENTENDVLSRILKCQPAAGASSKALTGGVGVYDSRNGVRFAEGFEIYRNYKGKRYAAVAQGGVWVRKDNGQTFPTLNQLNGSIANGAENVWNGNWKYRDDTGMERSIDALRR